MSSFSVPMDFHRLYAILALFFLSSMTAAWALPPDFVEEQLYKAQVKAVDLEFLPDGRLLMLGKTGEILIMDPQSAPPVSKGDYMTLTKINSVNEKGLLSIDLDPDFQNNGYFYVYYNYTPDPDNLDAEGEPVNRGYSRVSRFVHQENSGGLSSRGNLASETIIWEDLDPAERCCHFGGTVDFGPDGKLYLIIGDKFDNAVGQDLTRSGGKIYRLNKDGSIPAGNPDFSAIEPNALPGIWAYGIRNPFRSMWDRQTNRLFIGEVGGNDQATAAEDVHLGRAGANYGWPNCEGSACSPSKPSTPAPFDSFDLPIYSFQHQGDGAAIVGGPVYRGSQFPGSYQGAYFFGDYARATIRYITFNGNGNVSGDFDFHDAATKITSLHQGPDGALYYTRFGNSTLQRIRYIGSGNRPPVITQATASTESGPGPLPVTFTGVATDAENDSLAYHWVFGDGAEADGAIVTHTYSGNGTFTAFLQVTDGTTTVASNSLQIAVGSGPQVTIQTPADGTLFRGGATLEFSATATDPDEALGEANYTWEILFHHNDHFHTGPVFQGSSGSVYIETTGHAWNDNTRYEIIATVTDSDGLMDVRSVFVYPDKVDITLDTVPSGQTLYLDGIPRSTPYVYDTLIDFQHTISAPEAVCIGGTQYTLSSWSDGGQPEHDIIVPDTDATWKANYAAGGTCSGGNNVPVSSGLIVHLETDSGVTVSGDTVTGWQDLSGKGNHLVANGAPRVLSGELNGLDVIDLDGTDDSLVRSFGLNALPAGNADRTVFFFVNYREKGWGGFSYGTNSSNDLFGVAVNPTSNLAIQGWGGPNDIDSEVPGVGEGWLVQSVVLNASSLSHYRDGSLIDSFVQGYTTQPEKIVVGAEIDGAPVVSMQVAAALVYDRALSEGERQQVEAYLQNKYGDGVAAPAAAISISSPRDGSVLGGPNVTVSYTTTGFDLVNVDHVQLSLDGVSSEWQHEATGSYTFRGVSPGVHTLTAQLYKDHDTALSNSEALDSVTVTVKEVTVPTIAITSPEEGETVSGPSLSINYTVAGPFDHIHFTMDGAPAIMEFNPTGVFTFEGVSEGDHVITAELVNANHVELDNPEAADSVAVTVVNSQGGGGSTGGGSTGGGSTGGGSTSGGSTTGSTSGSGSASGGSVGGDSGGGGLDPFLLALLVIPGMARLRRGQRS
ncbi:MAG: PQQ-dependent sugar dehydrogenase [Pseudomonadota bacterium]|nr:PQQ-dependent sugar dehydrogenase [Pseudomonadota bacterium]